MNFGYAIDRLKMSGRAQRAAWQPNALLYMKNLGSPRVFMSVGDSIKFEYTPSQADMLAEDWRAI